MGLRRLQQRKANDHHLIISDLWITLTITFLTVASLSRPSRTMTGALMQPTILLSLRNLMLSLLQGPKKLLTNICRRRHRWLNRLVIIHHHQLSYFTLGPKSESHNDLCKKKQAVILS